MTRLDRLAASAQTPAALAVAAAARKAGRHWPPPTGPGWIGLYRAIMRAVIRGA